MRIFAGMWRSLVDRQIAPDNHDAKLGWLLVVGTVPAGLLGLLFQDSLRTVFASAQSAAFFLMLNGVMLYGAERLRRRAPVVETSDPLASDQRISGHHQLSRRGRHRRGPGDRADPRVLAQRCLDGRRPADRPLQRGRGALLVPAGDADHRRRRAAEAARPVRLDR